MLRYDGQTALSERTESSLVMTRRSAFSRFGVDEHATLRLDEQKCSSERLLCTMRLITESEDGWCRSSHGQLAARTL